MAPAITIAKAKTLDAAKEAAIVRAALARDPASPLLRQRLGVLYNFLDRFDEAIALFTPLAEAGSVRALVKLAEAHLARETDADTRAARDAAARATELGTVDDGVAGAWALLGKALVRLGAQDAAHDAFETALRIEPGNIDACKRLLTLDLDRDRPAAVLARADRFLAEGVAHTRVMIGRITALARLGRIDEARAAAGMPALFHTGMIDAPPPWPDSATFNAAIAEELNANPALRYGRYGLASVHSWRVDFPATPTTHAIHALQRAIVAEIDRYFARADRPRHPWLDALPDRALMTNWSVLTDAEGYEEWHVHQNGWLSGVYYVDVPDAIASGAGRAGCIAFGLPAEFAGAAAEAAYGETLIRPQTGMILLFPSHAYHRTFAHGGDRRRISFAFDIAPIRD